MFLTQSRWLFGALAAIVIVFAPLPTRVSDPVDRHFHIQAGNFAYAPATLSVNPGDRVTIEVVATDVVHGLYLDGYNLNVVADPGQTASLSFVADRAGVFRLRCSVTCGALHPFMIGKLSVGPNWLLWRAVAVAAILAITVLFSRSADRSRMARMKQ